MRMCEGWPRKRGCACGLLVGAGISGEGPGPCEQTNETSCLGSTFLHVGRSSAVGRGHASGFRRVIPEAQRVGDAFSDHTNRGTGKHYERFAFFELYRSLTCVTACAGITPYGTDAYSFLARRRFVSGRLISSLRVPTKFARVMR